VVPTAWPSSTGTSTTGTEPRSASTTARTCSSSRCTTTTARGTLRPTPRPAASPSAARASEGDTVNVPLPAGIGDPGYERLFDELVEPVVREYDPDLIVASAGGDAGALEPLGRNLLTKAGFETIGRRVRRLAADCTDGSLAAVQEGGYQPTHLAYAMLGTLEGLLGVETGVEDQFPLFEEDSELVADRIDELVAAHGEYWPVE